MNDPLLSIIVPMFKVEEFLPKCIDSIINQKLNSEIEIILVNDGSPDNSEKIARQYAEKDNRIKVISQTNQGLSAARNRGLKESKGEYVWFIDSDDWITPDSLSIIIDIINRDKPEGIHICGADVINGIPTKLFSLKNIENKIYTGLEILRSSFFHGVVQYTIYQRDFLLRNSLSFYEGIYHEDTEFSPRAYYYLKRVISVDKVLYHKRVNPDSITRTINPKKNLDLIKVACSLREFANKMSEPNNRKFYMRLSANALKMAMQNEIDYMSKSNCKLINQHIYNNKSVLGSFLESDRFIYKIQGFILKFLPKHVLTINSLLFYNKILRIRL